MLYRIILAVLCCLLWGTGACAQQLAQEMQSTYARMKGFTATFTQTLTHQESGSREVRNGTLIFKKPLLVRWETKAPHEELLLVTEKEIWNYLPDEELVYRYAPDLVQDSRTLIQVVTGQARLDQDFTVEEAGTEGKLVRLHLYPKEPVPQLVEAEIWVNADSKLIHRAIIVDFYGNRNEVAFQTLTPASSFPASAFSFTPPEGVDVEDRREEQVPERELFR